MFYILGIIIFCLYVNYKINKFADNINPYNFEKK